MLISKFNKLIHNKIVWAAFAVLVSLSMIGLFAPTVGGDGGEPSGSAGTLFDQTVSRDDLMRARLFAQAFQPSRGGEQEQQAVTEEAWGRLATLQYAERLGLGVSNAELSETIAQDPSFAENGVFSRRLYQQLVEGQMRVPLHIFEAYLREEILLRKVRNLLSTSLWVSPYELDQSVARFTDLFSIEFIKTAPEDLIPAVALSPDEIRAFYDRNPVLFEAPEQRRVLYVEWRATDLARTVNVPDMRIQDVYDRDVDQYSTIDTNTMTVSYTPFEEVADAIRADIAEKEAMNIAGEYALQFLDDLSMLDYGDDVSIHSVAKTFGLNVSTSVFFNASDPIDGINADIRFNQAAFRLDAGIPEKSYSSTVFGDGAVYILSWYTNQPAFLQPFEAVADQARALAEEDAQSHAFAARLAAIHEQLTAAAAGGTAFRDAAEALSLEVTSVGPFSVYDAGPEEIPYFSNLMPAILTLSTGEVAEPVHVNGGVLIASITARHPGDPMEAVALKPDITRMLQAGRMRMHLSTWSENLLSNARGTPLSSVQGDVEP